MLSKLNMFERYKEEKAIVIGSFEVRTGLEDFPSYKEWEEEYVEAWNDTHQVVGIKDADKIFDSLVDEADAELEGVVMELIAVESDEDEDEDQPTNVVSIKSKQVVKAKAKKVKTKIKAVKTKTTKSKPAVKNDKNAKAQAIFDANFPKMARKGIIAMFMSDVGLTAAGSSTYYQRMKTAYTTK